MMMMMMMITIIVVVVVVVENNGPTGISGTAQTVLEEARICALSIERGEGHASVTSSTACISGSITLSAMALSNMQTARG